MTRPSVFRYLDYRRFFLDWVEWRAAGRSRAGFSWEQLGRAAGLSRATMANVIANRRKPSVETVEGFCRAAELDVEESRFLHLLVEAERAGTIEERSLAWSEIFASPRFEKARVVRGTPEAPADSDAELDRFLASWVCVVLREIATEPEVVLEPEALATRLRFEVSTEEVALALGELESQGLLARDDAGRLRAVELRVTTPVHATSRYVEGYHREMLALAERGLSELSWQERFYCGVSIRVPPSRKAMLDAEAARLAKLLMDLMENEPPEGEPTEIWQLSLQLFPLARAGSGR